MMTTESPSAGPATRPPTGAPRPGGGSAPVLVKALGVTLTAGLVAALAALAVSGRDGALGVLVGLAVAVVVFSFGSFTVDVVARVLPAAALLVALLTYALQLVLVLVALSALEAFGAADGTLHRAWLAGALVGATLVWTAAQLVLHVRTRTPVYDLPGQGPSAGPSGPPPGDAS